MKIVRISAKAIIIEGDAVLLLEMRDSAGLYYILPGGGQENGETLRQTLKRECLEEIGTEVDVGDVALVRDYIEANHEFAGRKTGFHQVELMFRCLLPDRSLARLGHAPDARQTGVCWAPLASLLEYRLYPKCLGKEILRVARGERGTVYLGDVN